MKSSRSVRLNKEVKKQKSEKNLLVDTETKLIKYANPVLSVYLSELFKLCVKKGTYPDQHKIAEVISTLKKEIAAKPPTIDRFQSYLNLTRFSKNYYILVCILM